jgi:hypothetical protein
MGEVFRFKRLTVKVNLLYDQLRKDSLSLYDVKLNEPQQ